MITLHFILGGAFALFFIGLIAFLVYENLLKSEGESGSVKKFIFAVVLVILFFMIMGMCTGNDHSQWLPRHT